MPEVIHHYSVTEVLQPYMLVFYTAFLVTLILTPLMRFLAHRNGIVDNPDGRRKVHTQPIAYLGGVATFLGWLAGVTISVAIKPHNADANFFHNILVPPGVLLGAATVVLFGLLDDVYSLKPKIKLLGQLVAAIFLCLTGYLSHQVGVGSDQFLTPPRGAGSMLIIPLIHWQILPAGGEQWLVMVSTIISAIAAIFIIVAACNATNLLDGLDGLCSGVTGVMSVGYLALSVYLATKGASVELERGITDVDPTRITLSLALLGAVLGFLPYNFNPASIFMGDTGSMFLGYICGTMMLLFAQNGIVRWFMASVVIFGLPLLDTLLAIVRRKLNGRPIFSPDSNHFHHFLIRRGFSVRRAVLLCYGLAAMFVTFALLIVVIQTRLAMGVYLVLFGYLIVSAFKMGMIVQSKTPQVVNATVNTTVISLEPQAMHAVAAGADVSLAGK
jgi:UDP-GlcNAc:undecaprenyl-phosphate/decaprenyl-phosphate GlcNAc-1-phosphate transferase